MCGIAGIVNCSGEPINGGRLVRMIKTLEHRGPDESGTFIADGVGLAHRRLSIVDPSGGRQPMHSADRSLSITFNGELFNHVELRKALAEKGHRFETRSDTEVVLHLYAEYGDQCVHHMNGQWALAIWDARRQRLFLSRDRMGIRPLFYTFNGNRFLFGSEIKAILTYPDVPRRIDLLGLDQLFTFWSTLPPRTIFEGISELPPGHSMTVENGHLTVRRYWQLDFGNTTRECSDDEYADQFLDLLNDATRLRLRSDVPVGAYLSGGLDSSVTTALIQRFTDAPLSTFSVSFEDPEFDESEYQREVVRALGTDHRSIRCSYDDIGRVFPDVIWHTEKPILRTAPAPLYLLSALVRDSGYKVVMTGEGADEMLAGYDIFKEAKIRRFWAAQPESRYRPLLLKRLYPYMKNIQSQPESYLKSFFQVRPGELDHPIFSHLPRFELTAKLKSFLSRDVRAELAGVDAIAELESRLPSGFQDWDPLCRAQYLEATNLMPGYILSSQGDRMAMANSVEGRFPFLDHRVVEFAARLPARTKLRGLDEKHILKRAAAKIVPESVLKRPKQPYRAPDANSFIDTTTGSARFEYVEELLSPARIQADGLFEPAAVTKLLNKVKRGKAIGTRDNMALVGILSTQLVMERFIKSSTANTATERTADSVAALASLHPADGWSE